MAQAGGSSSSSGRSAGARLARGALIVIEGLDRSGKSTQVSRLAHALGAGEGRARVVKFPERTTTIGQMIDGYLTKKAEVDDRAIHLLFSANRWELAPSILKDLEAGKHIICDRYAFSGIAYSCAKGLPFSWCLNPDAGLPLPDLTLFLSLSPEVAAQRAAYGQERYEVPALQRKVREVFKDVGAALNRMHSRSREGEAEEGSQAWEEIDAGRTIEEVGVDLWGHVKAAVERVKAEGQPVGRLFVEKDQQS
ncbi:Thymidylate kinase [Tilletia horrida]|nr:Thymidylate kinase [Tilletia horrida]KAK0564532.1 Thymidylate kinase [Tilletia horrida]